MKIFIGCTLKEDQPLRLLLNLFFHHFYSSEPTYNSQRIKILDVIASCNQLNAVSSDFSGRYGHVEKVN